MTEEIIIDGVNVAGCRYILSDRTCYYEFSNDYEPTPCSLDHDCQYKQLKRLEQENKQMKSALKEIKNLVKEISYLGSRGERELKFKIKNILEDVIDEEIY